MMISEMIEKFLNRRLDKKKQEVTKMKWEKVRLEKQLYDLEKKASLKEKINE